MAQVHVIERGPLADCTKLLQNALDDVATGAEGGGEVVLSPGRYPTTTSLQVHGNTVLRGVAGAVIAPQDPAHAALHVMGEQVTLRDFAIVGVADRRFAADDSMGLTVVDSKHVTIERVRVENPAGAGMLFRNTQFFRVTGCTVKGSRADGFHVTSGCEYGEIIGNFALDTGDDCFAMVAYHKDGRLIRHMVIAGNCGRGGQARGVACLGGHYVTISGNTFAELGAAGIYLCQERSYDTYAPHGVSVVGNVMRDVSQRVGHAGIYIKGNPGTIPLADGTLMSNAVDMVTLSNNILDGSGNAGLYVSADTTNISGCNNILRNIRLRPTTIESADCKLEVVVAN